MKYPYLWVSVAVLASCTGNDHVTTPGQSVYNASVRKLQLELRGGGLGGGPPPGAACDQNVATYTLTVAKRELAWQYCEVTTTGETPTYTPRAGSRVLDDTEWKTLEPKLTALVVSDRDSCGADKEHQALIVTTDDGRFEYSDDFYACGDQSKPYIVSAALDAARGELDTFARGVVATLARDERGASAPVTGDRPGSVRTPGVRQGCPGWQRARRSRGSQVVVSATAHSLLDDQACRNI